MRTLATILTVGFALLLGFLQPASDRPLSVVVRGADWEMTNWGTIRRGQAGIIHAPKGDEFRIYLLSPSPRSAGESRIRVHTPSFPGKYFLVSSFDSGVQNRLGGYFNSFSSPPSSAATTIRRWEDGRRALSLDFLKAGSGFSGMWIHLFNYRSPSGERVYFDSSPFESLAFWVRGVLGSERILLKASDAAWERKEDALPIGEIADFLPQRRLEKYWQPAVIPLSRLPTGLNRRELSGLVFEALGPGQGRITVKDIAFCLDSQPPPLSPPSPLSGGGNSEGKALWVWNTRAILADPQQQNELASFCRKTQITHVFLQLPNEDDKLGSSGEIRLAEDKWRPFLELLNSTGLYAYALDGSKDYALPEWHARVLLTVENVIRFNRSVESRQRFRGIHYDIEPYLLDGFHGPRRQQILQDYLRLLQSIAAKTRPAGLAFAVDLPFWYDAPDELSGRPFLLEFGGRLKVASEHVIDLVDEVAIMDYRTSAYGADGIIAHAQDELIYAAKKGKRVFVGLETSDLPDEELLDFEGEPSRGLPGSQPTGSIVLVVPRPQAALVCLVSGSRWEGMKRMFEEERWDPRTVFWWPVMKTTPVVSHRLSFARLGVGRLDETAAEAQEELRRHRSFAGFALHDYVGYRRLLGVGP